MNKFSLSVLVCVFWLLGMWSAGLPGYFPFLGELKTAWIIGASLLTQFLLIWMILKRRGLEVSWWWISGLSLMCLPLWFMAFFYGGYYLAAYFVLSVGV